MDIAIRIGTEPRRQQRTVAVQALDAAVETAGNDQIRTTGQQADVDVTTAQIRPGEERGVPTGRVEHRQARAR
ncbi:hypothetical protein [Wenzhouxiangella marina]|uniref:hypothetical protein n=1 Tax=Wenzhouxiangella marina TaxID=1579979 RepID=UPI00183302DB|nr:hypothetical protein [Wenzhouxiangella marina]MBB6088085.1 hypothetical protein [Wenzhouxiangella marina]